MDESLCGKVFKIVIVNLESQLWLINVLIFIYSFIFDRFAMKIENYLREIVKKKSYLPIVRIPPYIENNPHFILTEAHFLSCRSITAS